MALPEEDRFVIQMSEDNLKAACALYIESVFRTQGDSVVAFPDSVKFENGGALIEVMKDSTKDN